MKTYYLYRHVRKDLNEVFYVGIGTKSIYKTTPNGIYYRAYDKNKSRNQFWKNIVEKTNYDIEILFESNDEELIKEKEKEFIRLYGIRSLGGTLVNLTMGGCGIEGFRHSDEAKAKIGLNSSTRVRKKGYKLNMSEEGRASISKAVKERIVTEDTRKKFSENLKGNKRGLGHKVSEEHKEKLRMRNFKIIEQISMDGEVVNIFNHPSQIKENGFDREYINRCLNGKRKTYKGFTWRRAKESKQLDSGEVDLETQESNGENESS